jgi:putative peptidoglycan lipid II flippase
MADVGDNDNERLANHSNQVAAGIVLSRLFGVLREALLGTLLGTGAAADAFRAALRIPNLLQNLLGEGVLSASFIPVYARLVDEGREREAGALAGATAAFLTVLVTVIVAVGMVFAEPLARVLTPGFTDGGERFALTVTLVRVVFPGVGLLVLSAWCLGVLNAHRQFFVSYVAPVFWNIAIIAALITAALLGGTDTTVAYAAAVGTVIGAFLQFVSQLPRLRRHATGLVFRLSSSVTGFRDVLGRFGTVVLGRGSVQLASYVELAVASLLAAGTLAALGYAQVLYLLPIGVFGMSVAAAELPELAAKQTHGLAAAQPTLDRALSRVAFFVAPSAVAFIFAGDRIVSLLYQGVRFTAEDVRHVGLIVTVYGFALLAATSSRVLQSVLYAVGDVKSPALYALIRVVAGLGIALALIFPLDAFQIGVEGITQVRDVTFGVTPLDERGALESLRRLGVIGLVIGSVAGAWLEYALLRRRVKRHGITPRVGGDNQKGILIAAACMALTGVILGLIVPLPVGGKFAGVWLLALLGTVYVLVALKLQIRDALRIKAVLTRFARG